MRTKNTEILKDIKDNYFDYEASHFADKYNLSPSYIRQLAGELKVGVKYRQSHNEPKIIEKYKSGISLKNIGKEFGHDRKTLINILRKNGCEIRTKRTSHILFNIDESYFERIDTHEKAYWLGFIYADGNIHENKLQIGLSKTDKNQLETFKKHIKSEHKLYDDGGEIKFIVRSDKICQDLKRLGVSPKKSLTLLPPTINMVNEEFINSFILGFLDGDGWITINSEKKKWAAGVVSTFEICKWIQDKISNVTNTKGCLYQEQRRGGKNTWYIVYGGTYKNKKTIQSIYNYLYKNNPVSLKRKKNKFLEALC